MKDHNSGHTSMARAGTVLACTLLLSVAAAAGGFGVAAAATQFSLSDSAPSDLAPGEQANVTYTIENTGDTSLNSLGMNLSTTSGVTITGVSSPASATITEDNTILFESVASGETVTANVTVEIASSATGAQSISAEATNGFGSDAITQTTTTQLYDGQESSDQLIVSLEPTSQSVSPESTTQYNVTVTGADNGIGAYEFNVSLNSTDSAVITNATPMGTTTDSPVASVTIDESGSMARIEAGSPNLTGNVIGTITVEGVSEGAATLSLSDVVLGDANFTSYTIDSTVNATVSVGGVTPPTIGTQPAKDPDSDGDYEDINGDGNFDIIDVGVLFENYQTTPVNDNTELFDFNGDGVVNIIDVGVLFGTV